MENLSDIIKREAIERNMCPEGIKGWADNTDADGLIEKYKKHIDFILLQDDPWPSSEFIRDNFDTETLHRNLFFIDETINLPDAPSGVYVINGACTGVLNFGQWAAATVYVRHDSRIRICADDFAKVFVRVYDDAVVETEAGERARIKVYDRR